MCLSSIERCTVERPELTGTRDRLVERGGQLIDSQPHARGAEDVRQLADDHGLRVITFLVTGATWHKLWIDAADRIVREVLIDSGRKT